MASDRRRILSANPMTPDSRFTVYFDGNCPICSREIATYRRSRGGETIDWIDASHCEAAALSGDLDRAAALQRFHVRGPDGTLIAGAAAFVEVWKRLPAFSRLARLCSGPRVLAMLDALYDGFLRLRRLWYTPSIPGGDSAPGRR
jgi:predicted DCC family thiol-disulfide oxidoreductase YuxK